MILFIIKRVLAGFALLFGVSTATFALVYSGGGDIAGQLLGGDAGPEAVAAKARQLGLDQPLMAQYWHWLTHAITGDLGVSWYSSQPVLPTILQRLSVTLSIVVVALLVVTLASVTIGIVAALRRGWIDRVLQTASVIGLALPSFWVGLVLVIVFAISLRWVPATGFVPFQESPARWFASIVLPVVALGLAAASATAQQVRSAVIGVLEQDYVRTLRARGLSGTRVLWGHVLRNAAPPGLTVLSLQFISMVGGAVIIERIFAINGMGSLAVDSTLKNDIPVVVGVMVVMTVVVVLINLAIDIVNGFINPKATVAS
ncbi:ABC transporter permease [Amycolatopsis sp. NPDC051371]|jgi:peptide/nickel transport system permease protein|uniref:ABC transporter permease n=1 Tax=Amycolatopsis sp. NPDC051371 TaxID=3155800 RepID=UPI00342B9A7C